MIEYKENFSMAFETLIAHKFRSFLTILGIVVGVLVVIIIASLLTGLRQSIVSQIESIGTNNIYAFHMNTGPQIGRRSRNEWKRRPLTVEDALALKELCPSVEDVSWSGMAAHTSVKIQYKNNTLRNADFNGVSPNYGSVANVKIANGRFFIDTEDRHRMEVAVIGPDSAEALFATSDPIGKQIHIQGHPFTVIGVTEKSKTGLLTDQADNFVLIPYHTLRKIMPWEDWHILYIQARSGLRDQAYDEAESLLRRRRGIGRKEENNFDLTTADKFIKQLDSITAALGIGMIAISGISLLVGGIGVMNIMLVSVTERTREIGVRKAIGATKRDIIFQFLFEAMTLTGMGGVFGIILAVGICYLLVLLFPLLPATVPAWAVITGLSVSIAIGLIFGVWPARKAAMLDPIEALRYE
jgi:putative ABC transport system permease protein